MADAERTAEAIIGLTTDVAKIVAKAKDRETVNLRRQLAEAQAARQTAEAACAAMRKDCAWQCSSYEDGARYCDFCHQKLPDHDRCCIFADTLGQALLDRLERYREALEAIRDGCRCTCGEPRNIYCPRCDAVAALDEKEKTDARH